LFNVLLFGLGILNLFDLFRLEDIKDFFGVLLGLVHGVFVDHLFLELALIHLLKDTLVLGLDGVLSFLAALGGSLNFLSFFLCLLNDDIDELRPLLDSDFHLDVEGCSHLFCLGIDISRSSFSSARKSLFGCLSNSL